MTMLRAYTFGRSAVGERFENHAIPPPKPIRPNVKSNSRHPCRSRPRVCPLRPSTRLPEISILSYTTRSSA